MASVSDWLATRPRATCTVAPADGRPELGDSTAPSLPTWPASQVAAAFDDALGAAPAVPMVLNATVAASSAAAATAPTRRLGVMGLEMDTSLLGSAHRGQRADLDGTATSSRCTVGARHRGPRRCRVSLG